MAKIFSEKQREIIARKLGYDGPMSGFEEFVKSDPAMEIKVRSLLTKYMKSGGFLKRFANGGDVSIDQLYLEVLGREADTGGKQFWTEFAAKPENAGKLREAFTAAAQDEIAANAARENTQTGGTTFRNNTRQSTQIDGTGSATTGTTAATTGTTTTQTTATQTQAQRDALREQVKQLYRTILNREPENDQVVDTWMTYFGDAIDPNEREAFIQEANKEQVAAYLKTRDAGGTTGTQTTGTQTTGTQTTGTQTTGTQTTGTQTGGTKTTGTQTTGTQTTGTQTTGTQTGGTKTTTTTTPVGTAPAMPTTPTMTAATISEQPDQMIGAGVGQAGTAETVAAPTAVTAATAAAPEAVAAQTYTATQAQPAVSGVLADLEAAQGTVSPEAQVQAATMEPTSTAVGTVEAAQGEAAQVVKPAERKVEEGELITGPSVDQARVEETLAKAQAAQGEVTSEMTLQGQLGKMLADFDTGNPPTWAAATMRAATAQLAARGLGASSLAGQAVIQAALEAATPIAAADAQVFQQMGLQNLSNRQQMAVLTAQQRATFLGQEFDQAFQTKVLNAAKVSDIANRNFDASVQIALENARLTQSMNLANLSNKQALVMAEAAQIANLETQNLSNQQQAAVENARAFLQMDMANLNNRQQTALFKAQEMTRTILSDVASQNAAKQFNATSQMQVEQFNTSMATQVSQFNASQQNAMAQFNANRETAIAQFNASQKNAREEFNAKNSLIVAQSNAEWRRQIATANTAAQNVANQFNAQSALTLTNTQYAAQWQTYRDTLQYAHQAAEGDLDRENRLALQTLQADAAKYAADREIKASMYKALGNLGASILSCAGGAVVVGKFVDGVSNTVVAGINAVSKFLSGGSSDVTEVFPDDADFGVRYFSNGVYIDTNTNTYYDSTGNVIWQPLEDELIEFDFGGDGDYTGGGEG